MPRLGGTLLGRQNRGVFPPPGGVVAGAAFDAAVLALSPFLYWKLADLSGTVCTDASPNARNGTYTAGVVLGQPSLLPHGGGQSVTASSTTGVATSSVNPFTGDFTIGGWANVPNFTGQVTLFGSSNATNGPLLVLANTTGQPTWWSDLAAATQVWVGGDFPSGSNVFWCQTWANATKVSELFINAVSKGQRTSVNALNATPGNFALAAATVSPGFRGPMGNSFVIPSVLTPAQITTLFNAA